MAAKVLHLTDYRCRAAVGELLGVQAQIDRSARLLLAGRKPDVDLTELLNQLDAIMARLEAMTRQVSSVELQGAVSKVVASHKAWSAARLGTVAERKAATTFLANLDSLKKVAGV